MGLTILDAGIIIAVLDSLDAHHASATRHLTEARAQGDEFAIPVSAYAEALVSPSRVGTEAVDVLDRFLDAMPVRVEPATRQIGANAAALRARHGRSLRLPDALVVATADVLRADRIITTDMGWPRLTVRVEIVGPESGLSPRSGSASGPP